MNEKFVAALNRKIKSLNNDNHYLREEVVEDILNSYVRKEFEEIIDYHIGFFSLYQENKTLVKALEKHKKLLLNPANYRHEISVGPMISRRELRLPDDQTSTWQLLYETTVFPEEESGPILHLYFDGWEVKRYKIYYWDQSLWNDVSDEEELEEVKSKISALGFQLDDNISDEAALFIKSLLEKRFPNQ